MLWLTDRVGLNILLDPIVMGTCHESSEAAGQSAVDATNLILNAGYQVAGSQAGAKNFNTTCVSTSLPVHPFDSMFVTRLEGGVIPQLELKVEEWQISSLATSYFQCWNS